MNYQYDADCGLATFTWFEGQTFKIIAVKV